MSCLGQNLNVQFSVFGPHAVSLERKLGSFCVLWGGIFMFDDFLLTLKRALINWQIILTLSKILNLRCLLVIGVLVFFCLGSLFH